MSIKVIPKRKIVPPVPESNQVWYLLLHLGVPSTLGESSHQHMVQAKRACKVLGLTLDVFPLASSKKFLPNERYFYRLPRYRRDDKLATHLGETILNLAWVTCGPLGALNDPATTIRIPRQLIDRGLPLSLDDLTTLEYSRDWSDRVLYFPDETIGSFTGFSEEDILEVWRRLPAVVANDYLSRVIRFLKASIENFYVHPGQITEILDDPDVAAQSPSEQTHLETAVHSAFMALEAIIGNPSKDDRKLYSRLHEIGLDPLEEVGCSTKKPLLQMIRDFNNTRDKKSAHGSTRERRITVLETLEFQSCAEYVVAAALDMASVKWHNNP